MMEIAGLPLHALVVHLAVTLVPVSAALAVALAVPRWRWWSRWPAAVSAVGALVVVWLARVSGAALLEDRPFLRDTEPLATLVRRHEALGELLSLVTIPFTVLVVLAAWGLGGSSAPAGGRGVAARWGRGLDIVLSVVLVALAVGVLVLVVLAGHAGSRAVWG